MICALQIDPIEILKYQSDTSILIANALQKLGFKIFCYTPNQLYIENATIKAKGHYIKLFDNPDNFYKFDSFESTLALDNCKLVMVRQDPPFDMNYITNTYLLELLNQKVLVINNPRSIRNWPEKLSVFKFQEFIPPTHVSSNIDKISEFFSRHKNIIVKPIYGSGGANVCKIENAAHFNQIIPNYIAQYNHIIVQKFFPEIVEGDKRVLIVDGEILGAIGRVPPEGGYLANLAAGGTAIKTTLTEREQEISQTVATALKKDDIFFAGIDLINQHLIEINVTSPTGCKAYNALYNKNCENIIVKHIIDKIHNRN